MNFAFFEQLDDQEAQAVLENYRRDGAERVEDLAAVVHARGGILDFSVGSVRRAFEIVATEMTTVPTAVDESLPDWIKNSDSYRSGLYDFDGASRLLVVRLSFYLAETLRRASGSALQWGVGDRDTAVQNQPVLDGFTHSMQMSPLLVTENLLRRLVEDNDPSAADDVDRAIATWQGLINGRGR